MLPILQILRCQPGVNPSIACLLEVLQGLWVEFWYRSYNSKEINNDKHLMQQTFNAYPFNPIFLFLLKLTLKSYINLI